MKTKKLTLNKIQQLDNKFNEQKKVILLGEYECLIDKEFRKSKIQKMIIDYFNIIQELEKLKIEADHIVKSVGILNTLIVKYFTDLPIPDSENVSQLLQITDRLLDLGILEELFNENGFEQSQLDLISQELDKSSDNLSKLFDSMVFGKENNSRNESDINVGVIEEKTPAN